MVKKIMIIILALVLLILLVVGGYLAYLLIDYHRIEDNQVLEPVPNAQGTLAVGEELKLVTWNMGFAAYSDDYSFFMDGGTESRAFSKQAVLDNTKFVTDTLADQNADIMLLQEVDFDSTRSYHVDEAELVRTAFPQYTSVFAQNYDSGYLMYPVTKPHGASRSGLLTLVDCDVTGALRRSLPIEKGLRKFFDLDRCYAVIRIPTADGRELCLYNLHLSAYTADGKIATEQIGLLLADMQGEYDAGNYVIAGGDFNKDVWGDSGAVTGISGENYSWAQPFPVELLPACFTLVDSKDTENPVLSCRDTGAPYEKGKTYEVTLDAFIVSDNVKVKQCGVIDTGFVSTDHNPVGMIFELDGTKGA